MSTAINYSLGKLLKEQIGDYSYTERLVIIDSNLCRFLEKERSKKDLDLKPFIHLITAVNREYERMFPDLFTEEIDIRDKSLTLGTALALFQLGAGWFAFRASPQNVEDRLAYYLSVLRPHLRKRVLERSDSSLELKSCKLMGAGNETDVVPF